MSDTNEAAYGGLAEIYDLLQIDVDPVQWADYIESLDRRYSSRKTPGDGNGGRPILLDLGCGTGSFCLEMARRGYDPIGIDQSESMLDQARRKCDDLPAEDAGSHCLFLNQDISQFELYGTVDLACCLLDTVNHLIQPEQVRCLFRLCANYLNHGSLLIFDLATARHLAETLGNNLFFEDQADYSLFWQNQYNQQNKISTSEITLFQKAADGRYLRFDEMIEERCYESQDIRQWLEIAGLELVCCLGDLSNQPASEADERHFYVARRPDNNQEN